MANPNVTLRVSGSLRTHLEECTGPNGDYETPSEYLRDLIRRDMQNKDSIKWERVRASLAEGLSFDEREYQSIDRAELKRRGRARNGLRNEE
ncbi:MAG: addiction module antitoxin [Hahellaceae bacterium]|jgi:Arc/MetJ-type ribon-helix-helix transcriptional regulator|nr:addiction module antitoxin [Hahellaceae bacterium]MCP5211508.1 addiction module antitoxin [Hahellaceae bacterium]